MSSFSGVWTYRSYFNLPEVEKFEELRFAEAELKLNDGETEDFLTGRLSFGAIYLDVIAFVTRQQDRQLVRMRATGIVGTPTEGWIYDYVGELADEWAHGDGQRPAIVGTVIRTRPHAPSRPAGFSASFIAVHRSVPPRRYRLPEAVTAHFSARMHRLHHAAWHGIRNAWDVMDEKQREAVAQLGWKTDRPGRSYGKGGEFKAPHVTNGSGEDFLFFHRQMVTAYKELMAASGEELKEWVTIPEPGGDPSNAIPSLWPVAGLGGFERRLAAVKSDTHYWSRIRWWDQTFKDPTYLSTLSLGELGSLLEFSVHNDMHMRWAAAPRDPETNELLVAGRPQNDFSSKWNSPEYDWLGEFYSSHVNPFFWRLHGWIDDRIDDWFAAHEKRHPGEVTSMLLGGVSWFAKGSWVQIDKPWVWPDSLGGFKNAHGAHGGHGDGGDGQQGEQDLEARRIASLEAVVAVLYPPEEAVSTLNAAGGVRPSSHPALSPVFGLNEMGVR